MYVNVKINGEGRVEYITSISYHREIPDFQFKMPQTPRSTWAPATSMFSLVFKKVNIFMSILSQ